MSERTPPALVWEQRDRIRERLRGASELLVCLDFDGTLAPIVEDPDEATPRPENEAAVERLAAHPAITTAIVSGRALADVRERIDGPSIYAGNHGLELEREGSVAVHPVARSRANRLAAVTSALEELASTVPSCRVENKRLTGTVHVRSVPEAARPLLRRRTREIVDRIGGDDLEISTGKRILEIEPAVPWGKGNAVELLETDRSAGVRSIYVGDDVTDESAFRAVEPEGVGVRVGGDDPSVASARVESPSAVGGLLRWIESIADEVVDDPPTPSNPPALPRST
ncbi:trehalose-phosphatase [Halosolutus gelatinilyticus]|uniref:trehalose-phosphatase n=1 Tax=Halosolutus gelatinilyticus TaxID=2931975 RepID=UPI001FF2A5FB|nr:trehalose-phosphatase [Halosolutus gelatinilyticus]